MQQTSILIQLLHKWLYFNNTTAKQQLITNFNYKTDLYNQCYLSDSNNICLLKTNQNIPYCFVLIQYFSLKQHAISKLLSLRQNIANPFIKTIKLIVDKIYTIQELGIKSEKLIQIVYDDTQQPDLQSVIEIVSFPDSYIIFSDGYTIYNNIDSIINKLCFSIKISQTNNSIDSIIWYSNILDNLNNTLYQKRFKNIDTNLVFSDTTLLEKLICCFMKIGYKIDILDTPEANTKTTQDKPTTQDKNTTYDILNIKPENLNNIQQYPIVLSYNIDTITNSNDNIYELCIQNNRFIERICKSNIKFYIADGFSIDSVFIYKIAKYFQDTSNNVLFRELQLYSLSQYNISINNDNDLFIIIDEYTTGLNNATDCFAPHPLSKEVRENKLVELFMSTQRLNNEYDIKLRTGNNILLNECWINNLQDKDIIIIDYSYNSSKTQPSKTSKTSKLDTYLQNNHFKFKTISLINTDINIKDYTKHIQYLYNDTIKCIESNNLRNPIVLLCTGLFDNPLGYMLYKNDISLICIGKSINTLLENSQI